MDLTAIYWTTVIVKCRPVDSSCGKVWAAVLAGMVEAAVLGGNGRCLERSRGF